MSREALARVVQRSISDGAFRRQLATDPTGALRGYELSSDEFAAVKSGDPVRLTALGIEQRMSKAFSLAGASSVSNVSSSDLGASWTGAHTIGGGAMAGGALIDQGGAAGGAVLTAGGVPTDEGQLMGSSALTSGDASDTDPVIADTTGAGRDAAVIPGNPAHALDSETSAGGAGWDNALTPGDSEVQNVLTGDHAYPWPGESGQQDVLVTDEGGGGATSPGESIDGPAISQ